MPGTANIAWTQIPVQDVTIFSSVTGSSTASGNNPTFRLTNVPPNALLVLAIGTNGTAAGDFVITSAPSLTWTKRADASGVNTGVAEIWTAPFPNGGTIHVAAARPTGDRTGGVLYAITGNESALAGASGTEANGSAPSVTVVTTKVNSILFGVTADWNGVDGAVRTLRDTATETLYYRIDGNVTVYVYYKQCTTVASHTLGVSSPTGQIATTAVYEIRGSL